MGNWLKKYMWFIVISVLLLLLPLLINLCYLWESSYNVLHAPSAWTTFWATYLAAIGSFTMVFMTWLTIKQNNAILKQNETQLKEIKYQWEEDHRPKIEIYLTKDSITNDRKIEVVNIGASPAENITFSIYKEFIDKAPINDTEKKELEKLGNTTSIFLFPNETMSFTLYEREYIPTGGNHSEIYTIAGAPVDKTIFSKFVEHLSKYGEIYINGTYNSKYEIKTSINANRTRCHYSSISKSIDNVSENILYLNRTMHNIGSKTKEEK